MGFEVTLPESLLPVAERAAAASGMSLEAYVAEAVRLHLEDDSDAAIADFFTPDRIAEIRAASEEARYEGSIGLDQFKAERGQWRTEWQANRRA